MMNELIIICYYNIMGEWMDASGIHVEPPLHPQQLPHHPATPEVLPTHLILT